MAPEFIRHVAVELVVHGLEVSAHWSDAVSVDASFCVQKTGSQPDDLLREWANSRLRNASRSAYVHSSPKEIPEQDVKLPLY